MIVPLHADNPGAMTGSGNWTYLLTGNEPVLIDAGVGRESHIESLARERPDGPVHVLVTHAHSDHISGVTALRARWPETRFSKMRWAERDERYAVAWQALADGDLIPAGDRHLQVVHTPGHAPDHLAFWEPSSRTVFSGDLVVAGSTVVIPATSGGSLSAYLRSLERILALEPLRLLPAHGDAIDDPETVIRHYLAHRRQREEQVVDGLRQGLRTLDALVDRIYLGLTPALVPMARESVLAHLLKLQDDGVARREGETWELY